MCNSILSLSLPLYLSFPWELPCRAAMKGAIAPPSGPLTAEPNRREDVLESPQLEGSAACHRPDLCCGSPDESQPAPLSPRGLHASVTYSSSKIILSF